MRLQVSSSLYKFLSRDLPGFGKGFDTRLREIVTLYLLSKAFIIHATCKTMSSDQNI